MKKKDFELIARALRTARELSDLRYGTIRAGEERSLPALAARIALDIAAEALADELASTNPLFKRDRFLEATR